MILALPTLKTRYVLRVKGFGRGFVPVAKLRAFSLARTALLANGQRLARSERRVRRLLELLSQHFEWFARAAQIFRRPLAFVRITACLEFRLRSRSPGGRGPREARAGRLLESTLRIHPSPRERSRASVQSRGPMTWSGLCCGVRPANVLPTSKTFGSAPLPLLQIVRKQEPTSELEPLTCPHYE